MSTSSPLRVVVADDSPIVRTVVRHAFEDDGGIEVVAEAFDGVDALRQVAATSPDVLVLDLDMPRLSGFEVITRQLGARPLPILVLTGLPRSGDPGHAVRALDLGALDVMVKPSAWEPESARALCSRVRLLARVGIHRLPRRPPPASAPTPAPTATPVRYLGIGASTGGPPLLARLLAALPATPSAAVLVVQHIDRAFVDGFAQWLSAEAKRPVRLATRGERPGPGDVRVAPAGQHLVVAPDGTLLFEAPQASQVHVPSVDVLLGSLADGHGARAAGVLLSGMGDDGAAGLGRLHRAGATTFVQDPAEAVAPGMPTAAISAGAASAVLGLDALGRALGALLQERNASRKSGAP